MSRKRLTVELAQRFAARSSISKESRDWLDDFILREIESGYRNWRRMREFGREEPCFDVTILMDIVEIAALPSDLFVAAYNRRKLRGFVEASCKRLLRKGKLIASEGIGSRGRPVRCYEPA